MAKVKVACAFCGAELWRYPRFGRDGQNYYCDKYCFHEHERKTASSGKDHPDWKDKAIVKCDWCGKEFERHYSIIEKQKNNFCCQECHYEWLRKYAPVKEQHPNWGGGKISVECSWCGVELKRWPFEVKRRSVKFFCSSKHRGLFYAPYQSKEGNNNWRGGYKPYYGPNWEEQRAHARQRDRYHCRMCGVAQDDLPRELDVHHIVPFREFGYISGENDHYLRANRLSNLVSLCPECHGAANFMTPADLHLRLITL